MKVYDFNVRMSNGEEKSLSDYKGDVLLIVNTASFCGYTKQLLGLERDYQQLKDKGFQILAFPANQFLDQEPDDIDTIVKRYHEEYGVTFPIFDKVMVNGANADPLFEYLKAQLAFDPESNTPESMIPHYKKIDPDYKNNSDIKWNFTKFLIDREGNPVKRFEPEETPSNILEDIEAII